MRLHTSRYIEIVPLPYNTEVHVHYRYTLTCKDGLSVDQLFQSSLNHLLCV